ncbi:MAG: hypothetical protein UU34_C0008G0034 [Candidatus Curtissbacteria bacterium GW2011_GWA1_41_11]|uniref:Uncharacterized protein n=1 Tax=Candidatus Curtissbacteria bacterium GW2011_GWA1_41_11 TaxID=1618409 RepID=A0A0G0WRB6_9BACT|nr:MAG: hypothetical protein UU34_C0008G0034 [Candidatus Curtissbacteria bacterium GW2011_GWA1_41_11]
MIFVIIGIIILVVSFIIALQSLVKEQKKAQTLEDNEEFHGEKDVDSKPGKKEQLPSVSEEERRVPTDREPFFWEKDFGVNVLNKTGNDQDEIERLKSQLAQITAAKDVPSIEKDEVERDDVYHTGKNLSGEILLRDLKKKAA